MEVPWLLTDTGVCLLPLQVECGSALAADGHMGVFASSAGRM